MHCAITFLNNFLKLFKWEHTWEWEKNMPIEPTILTAFIFVTWRIFYMPCCRLLLATCLTHLAYLGCAFLLDWQNIGLSRTCSCQFLPCDSSLPWCKVAKLVRKAARSKQQHGIIQQFFACSRHKCVILIIYLRHQILHQRFGVTSTTYLTSTPRSNKTSRLPLNSKT